MRALRQDIRNVAIVAHVRVLLHDRRARRVGVAHHEVPHHAGFCVIENVTGIFVFSATRSIIGRSSLMVERSSTNCRTPSRHCSR